MHFSPEDPASFSLEKRPVPDKNQPARDSPMNLEPAPRLNKTPFVVTAAGCITVIILIGLFAPNKFAPLPFLSAVGFLIISITAIMIPILIDYAADSAEYVQQERERVSEQVQRLHAAGESLARAAAQIKAVEEAVHKTAHAAENLPYRMQEKLAEFNQQLAQTEDEEKERMGEELAALRQSESERLQAIADKIHKATGDWAALELASRKQLAAAQDAVAKLDEKLKGTFTQIESRVAELGKAAAPAVRATPPAAPAPVPAVETKPEPVATQAVVIESVTLSEAAPIIEEPKPRKPRAPRKPRPEETLAAMSEPSAAPINESGGSSDSTPPQSSEESPAAPTESSTSSDGATRLLATAYIGIGNKLFIRGDGPGLSWDKGVPMQFVSIGKWGWASPDAAAPVRCKLYKNDETVAVSGEVVLEPGKHVEVTALF